MNIVKEFQLEGRSKKVSSKDNNMDSLHSIFKIVTNKDNKLIVRNFQPDLIFENSNTFAKEVAYFLKESANALIQKFKQNFELPETISVIDNHNTALSEKEFYLDGFVNYDDTDDPDVWYNDSYFKIQMDSSLTKSNLVINHYQPNLVLEDQKEFTITLITLLKESADLITEKFSSSK